MLNAPARPAGVLRRRVLATATAAALGAGTLAAGATLTTTSAVAADAPTQAVVSVIKDTTDVSGMTVNVTGSGFDPTLAIGTRPPASGLQAGSYVVFGKFSDVWQPSVDGTSLGEDRVSGNQRWAMPYASREASPFIPDPDDPLYTDLEADGTFETTVVLNPEDPKFDEIDGNWGIYTYAGSGAIVETYETYTPIVFNDELTDFDIQAGVNVSKTAVADGETVSITGYSFDPQAAIGTRDPVDGQPAGTYVGFGRFADTWKPSEGATSAARKLGDNKWVTPTGAFGGVLNPDGTFRVDIIVDKGFTGVPETGNFGIYTYAGGGAKVSPEIPGIPQYETYTPITGPVVTTPPVTTPPVTTPPVVEKPAVKANAKTTLKLAKKKVKVGKRAKATVKVKAGSTDVTGKVLVKKGRKTLRSITLKASAGGKKVVRLPKLKKGKHKLRAVYQGSATVEADTSKKVTLRVVKKHKR